MQASIFPISLSGRIVILPSELLREPFSYATVLEKPEVRVRRGRKDFLFYIVPYNRIAICNIGDDAISGPVPLLHEDILRVDIPEKRTTGISAYDVYVGYGLDIAYEYLKHLYDAYSDSVLAPWLLVYLLGSIVHSGHEQLFDINSNKYHLLYLCTQLLRIFEHMDNKQPRMLSDMQPVEQELPDEILSRIITSSRVAKSIDREECSVLPEITEPESHYEITLLLDDGSPALYQFQDDNTTEEYRLRRDGTKFVLEYTVVPDIQPYQRVELYSLSEYISVFKKRGCNPTKSILTVLQRLRRETNPTDVDVVSRWIVQLTFEFQQGGDLGTARVFSNIYELAEELDRLLEMAIAHYRQ